MSRSNPDCTPPGPLLPVLRAIPLVRVQVRGAEVFAKAGQQMADAGLRLTSAAGAVLQPGDRHIPVSAALPTLRQVDASLRDGLTVLASAQRQVATLDRDRLVGPLGTARADLDRRLPAITAKATSAERGVSALISFLGGNGPSRYLIFSQNPDEVRPTGGYIGTYGVLTANGGQVTLDRYDSIESWYLAHPGTAVPSAQAPTAFQVSTPPVDQTIANVNATPDWPAAAQLAAKMWAKGGEQPVDGVLSVTPQFLAQLLTVLGPVAIPSYGETVTATNLVARADYYTHIETTAPANRGNRKEFVAEVARQVFSALLAAPASEWDPLARVAGTQLTAREAMVWSKDANVEATLTDHSWDGTLPHAPGDFFYDGEFEYAAKNGSGLRRTYDDHVVVHADGSATITTKITIADTLPADAAGADNIDSLSYITIYGPQGASLDRASDLPEALEAPIGGHPGASWLAAALPLGKTTLNVVWQAPAVIFKRPDGSVVYVLNWMRLPGHRAMCCTCRWISRRAWRWKGAAPPSVVNLSGDVAGQWAIKTD